MELIEEKSQAKKLRRKKDKEKEEEELKEEKGEADGMVDKEMREEKEGTEEGASDNSLLRLLDPSTIRHHPDSPTHIDTAILSTNVKMSQAVVKTEQGEASESPN